jgi:La-related protein 7
MSERDASISVSETLDHDDDPQSQPDEITSSSFSSDPALSRNLSFSRLNAKAPEFVPSSSSSTKSGAGRNHHQQQQPRVMISQPSHPGLVQVYTTSNSPYHVPFPHPQHVPVHYHHNQHRPFYQQEVAIQSQQQSTADVDPVAPPRNTLSEEATQKIISQVDYYFSDVNLATTDHLMRFISKDPEGYVPIHVVASFKKIKTLISGNSQLATILRNSTKLAVSEDGKKVRRQLPLTQSDMEELQSRIVVAENLPEDHCYQNLMKIFSSVGSVKTIRTCQPQTSNGGASSTTRTSKSDGILFSNKLHAFVEYESVELAEKAIAELNEEGNWRNGLRVRLLHRRTTKAGQGRNRSVGHEGENQRKEDDACTSDQQDPSEKQLEELSQPDPRSNNSNEPGEELVNDGSQKKVRAPRRGKGRGRPQQQQQYHHNNRGGHHVGTPPSNNNTFADQQSSLSLLVKQPPPGPRMPDGTRGFSLGRGKSISVGTS